MSGIQFSSPVTNQKASPSVYASSLATRPAPQLPGRIFVDTDNPSTGMYRDTGTAWVQIAGTGGGGSQDLQSVTDNGYTTTNPMQFLYGSTLSGTEIDFYNQDTESIAFKIDKRAQGISTNEALIIEATKDSGAEAQFGWLLDPSQNKLISFYDVNYQANGLNFDFVTPKYQIGKDFGQATNQYGYFGISQYTGDILQYVLTIKDSIDFAKTYLHRYNPEEGFLQEIRTNDNLLLSNFSQAEGYMSWLLENNVSSYQSYLYLGATQFTYTGSNTNTYESLGFQLDIDGNYIRTTQNGSTAGLKIDFANDITTLANSTCGLKMSSNRVSTSDGAGVDEFGMRVSYATQIELGDFAGVGNGTKFVVNDANQRVEFSTNLRSATAGGSSGQHLKVRVAGVDYKIALLNP